MNKILVGFDGSEGAEQALNRAMILLEEYGEMILLAVVPSRGDKTFVDVNAYNILKLKAKNLIDQTILDLGEHEFKIKGMVEQGDPASVIIDVANRLNVDLIVLGSKGQSEIGQYLIGSVANKVVQYAAKPVMVVR
jgi:nucleotide-binding universal stress UspA family protein